MTLIARTPQRRVEQCMGTVFSIDVRSDVAPAVVDRAIEWLHDVDRTFSTYRPDSEISQLIDGRTNIVSCRPDVATVLALCERFREETDGFFDAFAGGALDPSGVVKGWAVDQVDARLRAAGSTRHCINGGGDIRTAAEPDDRPWRLGIAHPLVPGKLVCVVEGRDLALATSGTAERGEHIFDPHTRRPPQGLAGVTLVGEELTRVDALATAAFAMGDAAREWIAQTDGIEGLVVTSAGTVWATSGFPVVL
jgi:FAD:protein FMN transferase